MALDSNIFFSLINPMSVNSYLFSSIGAEFSAPEFIKSEFEKHKSECLFKSKLSEHEFEIRQKEVEESIKFIKASEYEGFLEKAAALLIDPDDADILASALYTGASIWSNDLHLKKQPLVKVYTTEELADNLLKGEISE